MNSRIAMLAGGILMVFLVTLAVTESIMPGPHTRTDYLVIGAVGTFVSMLVLFVVLLQGWVKGGDTFYKRRGGPPSA